MVPKPDEETEPAEDRDSSASEPAGEGPAVDSKPLAAPAKRHWYWRISIGARMFFWSVYFGIFVVAAVVGIGVALVQMAASPMQVMHNPVTSMIILVTGTVGEMWCLHRNLGIYMIGLPGKEFARWGVYISVGALSLSFLLALTIVVLYMNQ